MLYLVSMRFVRLLYHCECSLCIMIIGWIVDLFEIASLLVKSYVEVIYDQISSHISMLLRKKLY